MQERSTVTTRCLVNHVCYDTGHVCVRKYNYHSPSIGCCIGTGIVIMRAARLVVGKGTQSCQTAEVIRLHEIPSNKPKTYDYGYHAQFLMTGRTRGLAYLIPVLAVLFRPRSTIAGMFSRNRQYKYTSSLSSTQGLIRSPSRK
jgi:hypothetical protein